VDDFSVFFKDVVEHRFKSTVHNLRSHSRMRPSIMKFVAVLAYIEAKQTQGKKINRHDA